MTDTSKLTQKVEKTVPEHVLVSFKRGSQERERALQEELTKLKSELKIAKTNVDDDDEVSKVRAYLLSEEEKVNNLRAQFDTDLASFKERERETVVKALSAQYNVEQSELEGAEDPEKVALKLYAERLAGEKKGSPESVYELGTRGSAKKTPADMNDEEFKEYRQGLKREALSV